MGRVGEAASGGGKVKGKKDEEGNETAEYAEWGRKTTKEQD